jgi:hypothetical protein
MKIYPWQFIMLGTQQVIASVAAYPENIARGADMVVTETSPNAAATTVTSIWTTTMTSVLWQTPFGPNSKIDYNTIMTVTQIQPRGTLKSYPGTIVDTGITTV